MKPIRKKLWELFYGLAIMLLVAGCTTTKPPEPAFFDRAAWDPGIRTIALVGVSYAPHYLPPTDYDLDRNLSIFLGKELERKGYRVVVAGDEWNNLNTEKRPADQLASMAPAKADAALALHVDFLWFSVTVDSNPPPEAEIAAEARLVAREPVRELWRDWADATAGGAGGWPFPSLLYLRQQAVQELAEKLFDTLPNAGETVAGQE